MKPLVGNAADAAQVKGAENAEKRIKEKELKGIFVIMDTVEGRAYIFALIDFCGVFKTSFSIDNRIYFNEGQRNIGLKLIADIQESCPSLYSKMMAENAKKEEA